MNESYVRELEKLAVDAASLLRSVTKAKNVHVAKNPAALGRGGAQAIPSAAAASRAVDSFLAPKVRAVKRVQGVADRVPKVGGLRSRAQSIAREARNSVDLEARSMKRSTRANAGRIDIDPQGVDAALSMMSGVGGTKTTAGRKALTGVVASHDLAERAVKKRDVAPFSSHLSPEVLLKEHNTLSRLTGEGADEARKVMRNVRRRSGESEHMRNLVVQQYGPRAAQFFDEGEKIPKAMRKDLLRRLQRDPSILQRAAPGTLSSLRRAGRDIAEAPARVRGTVQGVRKLVDYIKDVP